MTYGGHSGDAPAVWGGIPLRNPDFTGRTELLDDLRERLIRDRAATLVPHTLHGMGGVGKTSLAVEYVYQSLTEYDLVWWISAERGAQISLSLVELAPRLGLAPGDDTTRTVTAVLDALRAGRPYANWLLVYDNAENPEALRHLLPVGGPGAILVTSRNARWAGIARPLEVDVFRRGESRHLLCARSPGIGHDDADRLADALGDLPLAIEQAAAWHAETGMDVDEYLRLLDEKRVDVLRDTASMPPQRSVMRRGAHLLLAASDPADPNDVGSWDRYRSLHAHVVASEAVRSDESRVRHLIVNEVVYLLRCGYYEASQELARTAHETWTRLLGEDHPQTLQVARWLGFVLTGMCRHKEAAALNSATLEAYRSSMGPDAQETIDALGNVAIDHRMRGDFVEALRLAESIHARYLLLLGPDDPETLRAAHNLGVSLRLVGDFAQALELDQRTWNGWIRHFGQDHLNSLRTWLGVVIDLRALGRYDTALTHMRRLVERTESLLGRDNPMSASALRQLAVTLRKVGEHEEAWEVSGRVLADLVRRHGEHNPESMAAALEFSVQLRQHGRPEGALALGTETWHRYEQTYGRPHPHTLSAAVSLALTYRRLGNASAAHRIDMLALRGFVGNLGEEHPSTLVCRANLAGDHATLGDAAAARELGVETLRRAGELLGDNHPFTLGCGTNLAHDLCGRHLCDEVGGRVDFDIDPMPL